MSGINFSTYCFRKFAASTQNVTKNYRPFFNLHNVDHGPANEMYGLLMQNPLNRYEGLPNLYGNCWFNTVRQFCRLVGFNEFTRWVECSDWREIYNDWNQHFLTFPHERFGTNPNGGFFQGQEMEAVLISLGLDIDNYLDYEGNRPNTVKRYQPYMGPKTLLPITFIQIKWANGDAHIVLAVQDGIMPNRWVVYDDGDVYCVRDPLTLPGAYPILGWSGSNMLLRYPVRDLKKKKRKQSAQVGDLCKGNKIATGVAMAEEAEQYHALVKGAGYSKPNNGGSNNSGNNGTQIFNYYNQHYQNSIDLSANAAGNQKPEGQLNQLIEAGSQLAGMVSRPIQKMLPALGFRSVDGNTATMDPCEMGVLRAYGGDRAAPPTSCADKATTPGEATDRNFVQVMGTWETTTAQKMCLVLPLPTGLQDTGVFGEMTRRHYCMKCGWKVQVQVNTSQFHAGSLAVFCIPEFQAYNSLAAQKNWSIAPENPNQWTLYPHQFINCRENTSVNFELPYLNLTPATSPMMHAPWCVVVMVCTPLQIPTGAATTVDILATVAPQRAQFHGLHDAVATQSVPVHVREDAGSFLNTHPDVSTPAYGKGFNPSVEYLPGEVTNFLSWATVPCLASLGSDTKFSFEASNSLQDSPLMQVDVVLTSNAMRRTAVAQLGFRYAQYRGSLNVSFMFTGASAVKGKFLIAYTPPGGNAPNTKAEAMQSTYVLWDVGATSSYTFNIPFISISDFRLTASSTTDVLSVDGWLSVFQYTSLTYPANTPERSEVVVLFSAGKDFCYRNLISARYQSGQVDIETGQKPEVDATQLEDRALAAPSAHTEVSFVMDRSWSLGRRTINADTPVSVQLALKDLEWNKDFKQWVQMFTYIKCDIELTLLKPEGFCWMRWDPVGASVQVDTSDKFHQKLGAVPVTCGSGNLKLSVPYTSPLSALPVFYLGKTKFGDNTLGEMPATSFGTVTIMQETGKAMRTYLQIRLKNFRGFCPRPVRNSGPSPGEERSRWDVDTNAVLVRGRARSMQKELGLTGGVESNPGPVASKAALKAEAELQGLGKFYNIVSGGLFGEMMDTTKEVGGAAKKMKETLGTIEEVFAGLKNTSSAFVWAKIAKKLFKMVSHAVIAYRCQDPVVLGLLGCDIVFDSAFDIYDIFRKYLSPLFQTPPPPVVEEQGTLQEVNQIFTLLKNTDWAIKLILHLKDWLQRWINNELETPQSKLAKILPEFNQAQKVLSKKDKTAQVEKGKWLPVVVETAELARQVGKIHIANAAEELLKAYHMASGHRTEPIVVVLRGDPGQGKTVAATLLAQMLSKKLVGCQSVYSLPPDAKYFDGYNGQTVVIMDDLGQNPDGQDFSTFCQMVSTTQFVTPQASISDKGTLFTSPIIIATTNSRNIRPVTIASPEAVERRFFLHLDTEAVAKDPMGRLDMTVALERQDCCAKEMEAFDGVLSFKPNILSANFLRFRSARDQKVVFSLETVYHMVLDRLASKEGMSDKLASIVLQGILPEHTVRMTERREFTEVIDGVETKIYREMEEVRDLENHMTTILTVAACVGQICTFASILFTFVSWCLKSPKTEETPKEEEAPVEEGPYTGTPPKKQEKKLEKQVLEGPYSGTGKKADIKKNLQKVVEQADEEYKKLEARFVKINKNEEPAVVQSQEVMDWEMSLIQRNLVPVVYYRGETQVASLTALKLCDGKVLINKHQFDYDTWDHISVGSWVGTRDEAKVVGFLNQATSLDYDVYVLEVPGMQCRDIRKHFTNAPPECEEITGICHSKRYPGLIWAGRVTRVLERLNTTTDVLPCTLSYSVPTKAGFCGAPVIATRKGQKVILGIHSAGNGTSGFGTIVTHRMIMAATQGIKIDQYLGPRVHVNRKSQIKKSPLWEVFKPKAGPAVLSQYDRRLFPEVVLEKTLFEKHTGNMKSLPKEFEIATEMYAAELFGKIGTDNGVVSVSKALNGDGVTDAMDMDTSVGYPYVLANAKRRDFVDVVETPQGNKLVPKEELVEEVKKYFTGQTKPIFVTFLKDEVRSEAKIQQGKTRIVDASPFPYAIAGRMVLMKFMSNMMRNNGTRTGSAVGCDPDVDWTRYAHELCDEYVFDIDYKAFDSTHTTAIFDLLASHFFLDKYGFDNELVRVFLRGLSTSWHVYEDQYFILEGGLPSGCPATSILNSVMNNIIVRAAILGVYKADSVQWDQFKMLAYGDDLVYSSPQPILPGELADWLHKNTLYKLTPASKAGSFPVESKIWDVTFLKRAFVPDEKFPLLIKPVMTLENLETLLSFTRPGTFPDKVRSIAGLAFHLPSAQYEKLAEALLSVDGCAYFPAQSYLKHVWYEKNS